MSQTHTNERETRSAIADGQLMQHAYDGIHEYDNPTPGWWHFLFAGMIVFSVLYMAVATLSPMFADPYDHLAAAETAEYERLFAGVGELSPDESTLLTLMEEATWQTLGANLFRGHCVSCHAAGGAGLVGPNLTDDHYKNVASVTDLFTIIADGAAKGAMPAWKSRLSNNEMVLLASYVASLRGTSPPNAKGPEGEVIPAWPSPDADRAAAATGNDPGAS